MAQNKKKMKKIALISVLLSVVFLVNAQNEKKRHLYALKSGYVKYELTGNTTGTEEMWWDNYGELTKVIIKAKTVTEILGFKNEQEDHKLEILNNNILYEVDYIENRNTKMDYSLDGQGGSQKNMSEEEQKKMEEKILKGMGGKRLGKEKFLSYNCEVITVLGFKSWIYKGIPLKTTGNILGLETNKIATSFQPNKRISASEFEPPKDVEFEDLTTQTPASNNPLSVAKEQMSRQKEQPEEVKEEPKEVVITEYTYEKFKSKIKAFHHKGYIRTVLTNIKGVYNAVFIKGFRKKMAVVATTRKNIEGDRDLSKYESFVLDGCKYYYGMETKGNRKISSITMEVPNSETYIGIIFTPKVSKSEMLKIAKEFNF